MLRKTARFYIVYQEAMKWMKMFFLVKNLKSGNRLLIEFMYKKVFYYIVLENYGRGFGLSEFSFKYKITDARSFSFLKPANAILVPLIHLDGLNK